MSKFGKIVLYVVIALSAMTAGFFLKTQQLTPQLSSDEKNGVRRNFFLQVFLMLKGICSRSHNGEVMCYW